MAKVIYSDLERAAPYTEFFGYEFTHHVPVEVPDHETEMLNLLSKNRWFKVEDWKRDGQEQAQAPVEVQAGAPVDEPAARIRAKGAQAWTEGRDRRVPPRWHEFSQAWLEGFDDAARNAVS